MLWGVVRSGVSVLLASANAALETVAPLARAFDVRGRAPA